MPAKIGRKIMKRLGDELIEEIIAEDNIRDSIHCVLRGTKRKNSRIGRCILKYEDKFIRSIAKRIKSGKFQTIRYQEMLVHDGPKVRRVQAIPILDRIAANAVMSVVEKHIFKRYIRTTGASIKNRGAHDLLEIIKRDIRENPDSMRYVYKSDYTKFYETICQDFMMFCLRRMFKGKILMYIFESFVRMMPSGISIGLRSSQVFGNILLSMFLDHYLKDHKRWKRYYRYCDDILSGAGTKSELWEFRNMMHERAEYMKLNIKEDERIFPIENGIDVLGYVVFPDIIRLRKRNKQNFARKIKYKKSKRRRIELTASFYGLCKHADCNHLFYMLTGVKMKDFKNLKIKPKYQDNKKRFDVTVVDIKDICNEKLIIHDYEKGIIPKWQREEYQQEVARATTKYNELRKKYGDNIPDDVSYVHPDDVPKPEGRMIILVENEEGQKSKFFTGDKEIWSIMEQADEMGEIPFRTTIKKIRNNNSFKYIFT